VGKGIAVSSGMIVVAKTTVEAGGAIVAIIGVPTGGIVDIGKTCPLS
jgi:hypothetical protein